MDIDLNAPIWTIEHVAAALHLHVDTAREYTYDPAFPAPRAGFGRHLWLREAVLAWFTALPPRSARARRTPSPAGTPLATGADRRAPRPAGATAPTPAPATPRIKSYKPRPR
ncbi:hypothetical protein [Oryzihumus leptocrescens]|nr:hypothetical protein [Oryzihumus leptocrescens]